MKPTMTETRFRELVMPECPRVFAEASRAVGSEGAKDVVQDMLRRLWEARDRLDTAASPAAYVRTVGHRVLIDHLRQSARVPTVELMENHAATAEAQSDTEIWDTRRCVNEALAKLPPLQRRVVELTSIAALSISEVAEATNMSTEAVRQNLSRGRRKLKELLKGITP